MVIIVVDHSNYDYNPQANYYTSQKQTEFMWLATCYLFRMQLNKAIAKWKQCISGAASVKPPPSHDHRNTRAYLSHKELVSLLPLLLLSYAHSNCLLWCWAGHQSKPILIYSWFGLALVSTYLPTPAPHHSWHYLRCPYDLLPFYILPAGQILEIITCGFLAMMIKKSPVVNFLHKT